MGITIAILAGLAAITAMAMVGDYFTKTRLAKLKGDQGKNDQLNKKIEGLELEIAEQRDRIAALEKDLSFTMRLLEDKSGGKAT